MHCSRRLIVQTLVFSRSYLHRQVSPPETLVVKGGTTWARNGQWILPENTRLPRNIRGSFTCRRSTTWDKRLYFSPDGRRAGDFFALKDPTASAGFEPANLCTKGQHATSNHGSRYCSVSLQHIYKVTSYIWLNVCLFVIYIGGDTILWYFYNPAFPSWKLPLLWCVLFLLSAYFYTLTYFINLTNFSFTDDDLTISDWNK